MWLFAFGNKSCDQSQKNSKLKMAAVTFLNVVYHL